MSIHTSIRCQVRVLISEAGDFTEMLTRRRCKRHRSRMYLDRVECGPPGPPFSPPGPDLLSSAM